MSLQRVNLHHSSGGGTSPSPDNGSGGRRSSVRKFMAILSAMAVVVAGLTVGVATPAQAAPATSPAETLLVTSNQFVLTLTPAAGKTWAIAADVKTNTTFDINETELKAGTWTRTSDTVITISVVSGLSGATTATVGDAAEAGGDLSTSTVAISQAKVDVTSAAFTMGAADNAATITLTGGTFKTGTIAAADFTFGGTDAVALAAGTFTRTSNTVVSITGLSNLSGADNTVLVLATTMANGAASVAGAGATITPQASATFTLVAGDNSTTITGNGVFADSITSADFTFTGTDLAALTAGTFTRGSAITVVIRHGGGLVGTDNIVTVLPSAQAAQSTTPTVTSTTVDVTSAVFTMIAGATTDTVTLTGGTFKAGDIVAADFTFAGTDAVALAAGTFTRTSDTVVTITGLSNLSGTNNTVLVKAATMTNGAASVTGASGAAPAPAPAPSGGGGSSTPSTPAVTTPAITTPAAPVTPAVPAPVAQTPAQIVQGLTPTQVQGLSATQLAALPPAAFAAMSRAQVKALNPAQVSGFTSAQIRAIPDESLRAMKPVTLKKFSVTQIRALTKAQASELRAKQIKKLGPVKRKIVNNKR